VPKKTTVTPERFCAVWQQSQSRAEIAKKLGISENRASVKANYYRSKGVALKRFPRGRTALDIDNLKRVVDGVVA
jgi:transposase